MKVAVLKKFGMMCAICTVVILPTLAQSTSSDKEKSPASSVGVGYGTPYGGTYGVNVEKPVSSNISAIAGIGIVSDGLLGVTTGWAIGGRLNSKEMNITEEYQLRPRVTAGVGVVGSRTKWTSLSYTTAVIGPFVGYGAALSTNNSRLKYDADILYSEAGVGLSVGVRF